MCSSCDGPLHDHSPYGNNPPVSLTAIQSPASSRQVRRCVSFASRIGQIHVGPTYRMPRARWFFFSCGEEVVSIPNKRICRARPSSITSHKNTLSCFGPCTHGMYAGSAPGPWLRCRATSTQSELSEHGEALYVHDEVAQQESYVWPEQEYTEGLACTSQSWLGYKTVERCAC